MEEIDRVQQMKTVQDEALELFKKKNQDYGDAFANYGSIGILVRMGDKINRMQSITTNHISLINTESLRDTLIDLHNYSAMAIMLLDEKKTSTQNLPNDISEQINKINKIDELNIRDPAYLACSEMAWDFMKHKDTIETSKLKANTQNTIETQGKI
jgi:hypothetical protein